MMALWSKLVIIASYCVNIINLSLQHKFNYISKELWNKVNALLKISCELPTVMKSWIASCIVISFYFPLVETYFIPQSSSIYNSLLPVDLDYSGDLKIINQANFQVYLTVKCFRYERVWALSIFTDLFLMAAKLLIWNSPAEYITVIIITIFTLSLNKTIDIQRLCSEVFSLTSGGYRKFVIFVSTEMLISLINIHFWLLNWITVFNQELSSIDCVWSNE